MNALRESNHLTIYTQKKYILWVKMKMPLFTMHRVKVFYNYNFLINMILVSTYNIRSYWIVIIIILKHQLIFVIKR